MGNGAWDTRIRQGKGKRERESEISAKTNGNEIKSWKMWSGDGVSVWTTNFPESLTLYVDSPVGGDKLRTYQKLLKYYYWLSSRREQIVNLLKIMIQVRRESVQTCTYLWARDCEAIILFGENNTTEKMRTWEKKIPSVSIHHKPLKKH